jgi:hypothetical protein
LGEADKVIHKDVECAEGPAAREQWVALEVQIRQAAGGGRGGGGVGDRVEPMGQRNPALSEITIGVVGD